MNKKFNAKIIQKHDKSVNFDSSNKKSGFGCCIKVNDFNAYDNKEKL